MDKPVTLADEAYQQIKRMLLIGHLVSGQKLRYQDIAQKIGMSRTPVMMALNRLANEDLVRSEPNKGFFIPELDLEEARELLEVRSMLEVYLVKDTAKKISEEQLKELKDLMDAHNEVHAGSYDRERSWLDRRLHLTLASFSGNAVTEKILRRIFDQIYLRYLPGRADVQRRSDTKSEHYQLLKALEEHDGVKAAKVLRDHLKGGIRYQLSIIKERVEADGSQYDLD